MSTIVSELGQSVELENALQQMFMECDVALSMSVTHTAISVGNEVPISRIVEHVQDQLPACSTELLLELQKCLVAVSTNDRVNLSQFREASHLWITKAQQVQSQDGNNNVQEKLCNIMSDTTSNSSVTTGMARDITEIELRMRVRQFDEENIILREELVRNEELVMNLERQNAHFENQLDRYIEKCQQLERENDEQKERLNEVTKNERTSAFALQRSMKEHKNLSKQLETAEIEVQAIPSLKDKIEKISKEKIGCMKQIVKLQKEFYEKENECDRLKTMITELEDTNINMKENYEYIIHNLREKNHQLVEENMELQSWSAVNGCVSGERFSISPIPNTDGCCIHSTPYKSEEIQPQNSLYAELKASGFTAECNRNDSSREELEEELNQYADAICIILEQLERVVQTFATIPASIDLPQFNLQDVDARAYNIEALKHKAALLLNTLQTTKEISEGITKESSTQLRAESDMTQSLDQFGITTFQGLLTGQYPKVEADLSVSSQCVSGDKDDPFLRAITANAGIHPDGNIMDPIMEELNKIILDITNPFVSTLSCSAYGNSRYRSIHTLYKCCDSRSHSPDVSLAQGDVPIQESCNRELAEFEIESCNDPDEENFIHSGRNQISGMPEVPDDQQMDSEILSASSETSTKSFQVAEIDNTDTPISPRRKISVYHRSFDVDRFDTRSVRDPGKDQESSLEAKRALNSPSAQTEKSSEETMENKACDHTNTFMHSFIGAYRSTKDDTDSSDGSSPQKQVDVLDEEIAIKQPSRKVYLAPTRLNFTQIQESVVDNLREELQEVPPEDKQIRNEVNKTVKSYFNTNLPVSDISSSSLTSVAKSKHNESDNASLHTSSTPLMDFDCEIVNNVIVESKSYSVNENLSQGYSAPTQLASHNQPDLTKTENSGDPHSQTNVRKVDGQSGTERSVDTQMSNRESSSVDSESKCELLKSNDQRIDEKIATSANETDGIANATSPASSVTLASVKIPFENVISQQNNSEIRNGDVSNTKQERRQRVFIARKSFSEGENNDRIECHCERNGKFQTTPLIQEEKQVRVFPSLTDIRLQVSGIANLSDAEVENRENLSELELQKRYTAFSLCLCTDRVTLPRRMTLALRQRDQSERNFSGEIQRMQQDIQELAPLCTDRESVERVEKVKHQLDMIAQCAHRVSCAAETLGATHQERRISRAVFLADRYLQVLQSKCEKLASNVAETKRILIENNIVIEENSGELGDDLSRMRYRSGTPANNRIMITRRRASVATMSRPMGGTQDMIKDATRQRNSVSGRVTSRRPSLSYESSKWETEEVDRTDLCLSSSNFSSISELRDIFEQAESRRGSREENNNMLRLNQSNSQNLINYSIADCESWANVKQEIPSEFPVNENSDEDCRPCTKSSQTCRIRSMIIISWRMMLWCILIFFFGFYVNRTISMMNTCDDQLNRWSVEEILRRYIRIRNAAPHPM